MHSFTCSRRGVYLQCSVIVLLLFFNLIAVAVPRSAHLTTALHRSPWTDPDWRFSSVAPYNLGTASDIRKDGVWFRDGSNRYVLFRGVNFSTRSKLPPYLPILPVSFTANLSPNTVVPTIDHYLEVAAPQLNLLDALGVNIVRLPIMWQAIEPYPNPNLSTLEPEGKVYLQATAEIVKHLWTDHGIYTIIDFHQDVASERYGGDGFPDWALAVDEHHPHTVGSADGGVPHYVPLPPRTDLKNPAWGLLYYDNPLFNDVNPFDPQLDDLVRHTLASFWNNDLTHKAQYCIPSRTSACPTNGPIELIHFPVRTHLEKTIGQAVKFFNDQGLRSAILGYEPFNEPHPVGLAKQDFESQILYAYYTNVLNEVRRYDRMAFLFVEPRADWITYSATGPEYQTFSFTQDPLTYLQAPTDPADRVVFSFHYYDNNLINHYGSGSSGCALAFVLGQGQSCDINMQHRAAIYPHVFGDLEAAGTDRGLIPFLTEFGCEPTWTDDPNLKPYRSVTEACIDLLFQQVEDYRLSETYWEYDLFNDAVTHDHWNIEDFSLLGPQQMPRNFAIVARPYAMRSSGNLEHECFDMFSKNAAVVIGKVESDQPTVVFVPRGLQYGDDFEVRVTSGQIKWNESHQLLFWQPAPTATSSALFLSPLGSFDRSKLRCVTSGAAPQTAAPIVTGKDYDNQLLTSR